MLKLSEIKILKIKSSSQFFGLNSAPFFFLYIKVKTYTIYDDRVNKQNALILS